MLSLARSLRQSEGIGEALPSVFPSMEQRGWLLRRAQVAMIAAAPNVGKSALALYMAIKLKMPTLYLSADTDPYTTILRAAAIHTGQSMRNIEEALQAGGETYYESILSELDYLRFSFDPGPTIEDIDLEISAFNEVYGEPPALLVIDNLVNVHCNDAEEFGGLRIVEQALHAVARSTGACVVVLHHVKDDDGLEPPPRKEIYGKITRRSEIIFTLGRQGQHLGLACVKNRCGAASPMADNAVWFFADLEHMQFHDPLETQVG